MSVIGNASGYIGVVLMVKTNPKLIMPIRIRSQSDYGKVEQNDTQNNKEIVAVQEPPVTQQPMTSQSLHVPDQVSSGAQTNQNGTVNSSETNSDDPNSSQQNTQAPKPEAMPNKYKSVKEYMKVENFMNEF